MGSICCAFLLEASLDSREFVFLNGMGGLDSREGCMP